ncbi:D-alanyl-D-alanine carboxypeptidase family protein [Paraburkholderia diazotrophica]|uniref:D-alanyl-D-alanine endopeptidase (Penicillin-binding protein 7) n=1 Tax=Paraburkholderia diazotrophica TaxID=667676 RepID=A0A1H6WCJ9_9BURK|nr:serine hydrolase [Paraburkholderia diazotrophica]SEJ14688.1 D-alanyl-D-alanine endopeptidase (penicillin-binding protein 7) [Paraburkholderia diazotrophica]
MLKLGGALLLAIAAVCAWADTPSLYSRSAIVYDVARGEVLLEKNADDVRPIASLTKLMTAMVVIDQAQVLTDTVTVEDADIDRLKHSGSHLSIGTSLEREDMLRMALVTSDNRAASALSRAYPGGQLAFVDAMNSKARALRMTDTHFGDPSGLSPGNVSTARDVIMMALAATRYPMISSFTTLARYEQAVGGRIRFYHNTDPVVLWPDWDVRLAKTGYTREAGRCIVVDAIVSGNPVIIALLGASSSRARAADLITIRAWMSGEPTPINMPRLYRAAAHSHHHHAATASHLHHVKVVSPAWRTISAIPSRRHAWHRINASRAAAQLYPTGKSGTMAAD